MIKKFLQWQGIWVLMLGFGLAMPTPLYAQRGGGGGGFGGGGGRGGGFTGSSASRSSSSTYPSPGQIGTAMISSDPDTRRIIVITDEETGKAIGNVVTNLDKPKPQVLIKVVFLEVTYGNNSDIGMDAGFVKKINPNNGISGSASNLFSTAALGASTLPVGAGGIYSIMGNDFYATLRAIQENGRTEVLSRPSIMARNNQQAIIMVGQKVPIITGSTTVGLTGQIVNSITYQDVGIILRVTPFISSDGLVEMIVSPEISSLASEGVNISTGTAGTTFNAPIINNRSAETVVVTPDSKPVIIGGLMENRKIDTTRKVPLLGDIPLLGALFKRKVKTDAKTELMIFLTPHIVYYPSQLAALSEKERTNWELANKTFSDKELDKFVDGLPVRTNTVTEVGTPAKKGSSNKKSKSSTVDRGMN